MAICASILAFLNSSTQHLLGKRDNREKSSLLQPCQSRYAIKLLPLCSITSAPVHSWPRTLWANGVASLVSSSTSLEKNTTPLGTLLGTSANWPLRELTLPLMFWFAPLQPNTVILGSQCWEPAFLQSCSLCLPSSSGPFTPDDLAWLQTSYREISLF